MHGRPEAAVSQAVSERGLRSFARKAFWRLAELTRPIQPDILATQLQFKLAHQRYANLKNPSDFSELVQARKLFDRDPRFTQLADKVAVKDVVARELGQDWLIPTLWSGSHLPPRAERTWRAPYVIKANHGSGWNIFVREGEHVNWAEIERTTEGWLRSRFSMVSRERFYDQIKPKLLVEPLVGNPATLPTDIKFFCFDGRVEYIMLQSDRHKALRIATLDRDWRLLPMRYGYDRPDETPERPVSLETMIAAAEKLSSPFDFVRIDFYEIDGKPVFGEYTFTPGSGFEVFDPYSFNELFGTCWRAAKRRREGCA